MVVSLASGQRPLMVLMQQGSQIAQIFGPGASLKGIAQWLETALDERSADEDD